MKIEPSAWHSAKQNFCSEMLYKIKPIKYYQTPVFLLLIEKYFSGGVVKNIPPPPTSGYSRHPILNPTPSHPLPLPKASVWLCSLYRNHGHMALRIATENGLNIPIPLKFQEREFRKSVTQQEEDTPSWCRGKDIDRQRWHLTIHSECLYFLHSTFV